MTGALALCALWSCVVLTLVRCAHDGPMTRWHWQVAAELAAIGSAVFLALAATLPA